MHAASIARPTADAVVTVTRVQPRDDLALMAGYHSPQLDVAVRLNTNESPFGPPEAWVDELAGALGDVAWNRYPDREAAALRAALAEHHGTDRRAGLLSPTAPTRCSSRSCWPTAAPGRTAATFEPTYAVHSHIARVTGTAVVQGERADDFTLDLDEVDRVLADDRPTSSSSAHPTTPRPASTPPEQVLAVVERCIGRRGAGGGGRGLRPVRAVDRARTWSTTTGRCSSPGRSPRPGPWPRVASATASAPSWVVDELAKVVLPVPPRRRDPAGRSPGPRPRRRHGRPGSSRSWPSGSGWWPAWTALAVHQWPSGANFVLFRPEAASGDDVWQALVDRGRPRAQLRLVAPPRGLPPGHRGHPRGERSLPDRPRGDPVSSHRHGRPRRPRRPTSS